MSKLFPLLLAILVFIFSDKVSTIKYTEHSLIYGLVVYFLFQFILSLNHKLAIPEFICLIYSIMYCGVPALMFDLGSQAIFPSALFGWDIIAISPTIYYRYAIGCTLSLFFGFKIFTKENIKKRIINAFEILFAKYDVIKIIYLFGTIALISNLIGNIIPSLAFVFHLGGNLSALILILTLFIEQKNKRNMFLLLATLLLILSAIRSAMFGSVLYFLIFYILFRGVIRGYSVKLMLASIPTGLFGLAILQQFKGAYRAETWATERVGSTGVAFDVLKSIFTKFDFDFFMLLVHGLLYRLNQAYLSSLTMVQVPKKTAFVNGQTLLDTVLIFIPRFVWPNKPELSDREMIINFGGYTPGPGVSMGIGQLGESYVNFGYLGGAIFIGIYGFIISLVLSKSINVIKKGNPVILFIPLILFYAMKAETSFSKVFNYGLKAFLFSLLIIFVMNKFCLNEKEESN